MTTFHIIEDELKEQASAFNTQANLASAERRHADSHVKELKANIEYMFKQHNETRSKLEELLTKVNGSIPAKTVEVERAQLAAKKASNNLREAVADLKDPKKNKDKATLDSYPVNEAKDAHRAAEKQMNKTYDRLIKAQKQLADLQGMVPKITAEIDETNRQIGQGLKAFAGLNNYDATGLSSFSLLVRASVLSSNLTTFAHDSQNTDEIQASTIQAQFLKDLPTNDFWEKKLGKDIISYFNSGDSSLQAGMASTAALEDSAWAKAHPAGVVKGEKEAKAAADAELKAEQDKRIKLQKLMTKLEKLNKESAEANANAEKWERRYNQPVMRAIEVVMGAEEPKDNYERWGKNLIHGGVGLLFLAAGLKVGGPKPPGSGTIGELPPSSATATRAIGQGATANAGSSSAGATATAGEIGSGATATAGSSSAGSAGAGAGATGGSGPIIGGGGGAAATAVSEAQLAAAAQEAGAAFNAAKGAVSSLQAAGVSGPQLQAALAERAAAKEALAQAIRALQTAFPK